jgi:HAMP domain-containing protein
LDKGFVIQFGGSLAAVAALVLFAAWARIARPTRPLDETQARALLALDFPDTPIEAVWIAQDGAGAVARSDKTALVLWRCGDGFVSRSTPWVRVLRGGFRNGRLSIDFGETGAPRADLALAAWPPEGLPA